MKNFSLFIAVFLGVWSMTPQQTFEIIWEQGVNGADASLTIETGDTVRWIWGNASPHSVTSLEGSQEDFDSTVITGEGTEFEFTFTQEGTNDYQCDVHPGSMFGTITVMDELSVDDKFAENVKVYPNPVENEVNLFSLYPLDSYKIVTISGQEIKKGIATGNFTEIKMADLKAGIYFITITSNDLKATLKLVKN